MRQGIIVGSDEAQEWLLPWWWKHYSRHNSYPVAFFDFGMSKKAKEWCAEKGALLSCQREQFPPYLGKDSWQASDFPTWRESTLQKPFAMGLTPFKTTIWIDLDCEICAPLSPLFNHLGKDKDFSIVQFSDGNFNSGVVVFKQGSLILKLWQKHCLDKSFATDDCALTDLLKSQNIPVLPLDETWNWHMYQGINPLAKICHFASAPGKDFIKNHSGIQDFRP